MKDTLLMSFFRSVPKQGKRGCVALRNDFSDKENASIVLVRAAGICKSTTSRFDREASWEDALPASFILFVA